MESEIKQTIRPQMPPPTRNITSLASKDMISPKTGGIIVMIGIIIFFIGIITNQMIIFMSASSASDYEAVRNVMGIGRLLSWIGLLIISLPLYGIGITCSRLDWKVRATMLSSATALIIASMIVAMMLSNYIPTYYYGMLS